MILGEECPRQREQVVQRPRGRSVAGKCEEQVGNQHGWGGMSKGVGEMRVERAGGRMWRDSWAMARALSFTWSEIGAIGVFRAERYSGLC